jgi:hypothetical protein
MAFIWACKVGIRTSSSLFVSLAVNGFVFARVGFVLLILSVMVCFNSWLAERAVLYNKRRCSFTMLSTMDVETF